MSQQGVREPYRSPVLPAEERVRDLLARMTLEEKAAQMVCVWNLKADQLVDAGGRFDPAYAPNGLRRRRSRDRRPMSRRWAMLILTLEEVSRCD